MLGRQQNQVQVQVQAKLRAKDYIPANSGSGLAEDGVVRRDGEVGHHVQDVSASNSVPRHHGDDRLRAAPHLYVEVEHAEAGHVFRAVIVPSFPSD